MFNRPETTRRVFEAIELARPKQLFVFADGPRSAAEEVECAQVRAIVGNVSWACDANYHYSETNRSSGSATHPASIGPLQLMKGSSWTMTAFQIRPSSGSPRTCCNGTETTSG